MSVFIETLYYHVFNLGSFFTCFGPEVDPLHWEMRVVCKWKGFIKSRKHAKNGLKRPRKGVLVTCICKLSSLTLGMLK
jgi:hypothetical protein